ncbi:hypothetical protein [Hahella sp. HN01]|uniref:hypothetical protein n=1 Tax=Hahella sp. HN01 TaxID=2847262 RepID=UPI001C1EBA5F|nr:hypothetical protein [Hahella sp. HN01]MBU6952595.1 hypothetical protein [Hahella sp. HN01]
MSEYSIEDKIEGVIGKTFPIGDGDRCGSFRELSSSDYEKVSSLVAINKTLAVYYLKRKLIGFDVSTILDFIECVVCEGEDIRRWEEERYE